MSRAKYSAAWTVPGAEDAVGVPSPLPDPDEHVPAGDPGGGDDTPLVLAGSLHRQEQAAPQEPGGGYRESWVTRGAICDISVMQYIV